jgi:hypothetical protein
MSENPHDLTAVQRAFTKQAEHYDAYDLSNPVLSCWRKIVYTHVDRFMRPASNILELNAGTGIDARHFVNNGHSVMATDVSPGMICKIQKKIEASAAATRFRVKQCSFENLKSLGNEEKFNYLFSNFGGLNCCENLDRVTRYLPEILSEGAFVTWVIMPPVCPWEIAGVLKGQNNALRRFVNGGVQANVEGETFQTYYHSLSDIQKAFGRRFKLIAAEGIGALSPPPSSDVAKRKPQVYSLLKGIDSVVTKIFPFNRWADHIIVTLKYQP